MVRPVAAAFAPIARCDSLRINCRCIQRTVTAWRALRCRLSPPLASLPAHSPLRPAHALSAQPPPLWTRQGRCAASWPARRRCRHSRRTLSRRDKPCCFPPSCSRVQVRKKRNREAEEAKPWCFLCCRGELAGCWPGGSCLPLAAVAATASCRCARTSGASYLCSTVLFPCFRVQR